MHSKHSHSQKGKIIMPKVVSFKPTEEESFACEYFMRTDARRSYSDVVRSQLMKAYNKLPKDRQAAHEAECRQKWMEDERS